VEGHDVQAKIALLGSYMIIIVTAHDYYSDHGGDGDYHYSDGGDDGCGSLPITM